MLPPAPTTRTELPLPKRDACTGNDAPASASRNCWSLATRRWGGSLSLSLRARFAPLACLAWIEKRDRVISARQADFSRIATKRPRGSIRGMLVSGIETNERPEFAIRRLSSSASFGELAKSRVLHVLIPIRVDDDDESWGGIEPSINAVIVRTRASDARANDGEKNSTRKKKSRVVEDSKSRRVANYRRRRTTFERRTRTWRRSD